MDTINEFLIEKGFIVSPADKHLQTKKMNVLILSYFWADIKHLPKTDEIMEVWKQNYLFLIHMIQIFICRIVMLKNQENLKYFLPDSRNLNSTMYKQEKT